MIIDSKTWRAFSFPIAGKKPPLKNVAAFLDRYGLKDGDNQNVHVDQGGEFGRSAAFRETVALAGYHIEPTGSDASWENGKGERPNQTFGRMV